MVKREGSGRHRRPRDHRTVVEVTRQVGNVILEFAVVVVTGAAGAPAAHAASTGAADTPEQAYGIAQLDRFDEELAGAALEMTGPSSTISEDHVPAEGLDDVAAMYPILYEVRTWDWPLD
jgi:hypothetical protein